MSLSTTQRSTGEIWSFVDSLLTLHILNLSTHFHALFLVSYSAISLLQKLGTFQKHSELIRVRSVIARAGNQTKSRVAEPAFSN